MGLRPYWFLPTSSAMSTRFGFSSMARSTCALASGSFSTTFSFWAFLTLASRDSRSFSARICCCRFSSKARYWSSDLLVAVDAAGVVAGVTLRPKSGPMIRVSAGARLLARVVALCCPLRSERSLGSSRNPVLGALVSGVICTGNAARHATCTSTMHENAVSRGPPA